MDRIPSEAATEQPAATMTTTPGTDTETVEVVVVCKGKQVEQQREDEVVAAAAEDAALSLDTDVEEDEGLPPRLRSSDAEVSRCAAGEALPPEPQEGNTEYKLKLINPTEYRLEHLVTQMKWRIAEGHGEAVYEIGVSDDGALTGLTREDLDASLGTLSEMARRVGAHATVLRTRETQDGGFVAEVHVRRVPDSQQFLDVRVGVVGNGGAGKSTLLGVLTSNELDNGRGKARLNLFRHHHEIKTGRTSSLSHEILGFDGEGRVVNVSTEDGTVKCTAEICENASKIITFADLPGHERYLRTTVYGLMGREINYVALVVAGNSGPGGTTREHLELAVTLKVPVFIIVTKVDLCSRSLLRKTLNEIMTVLKAPGINRVPLVVSNKDDVVVGADFHGDTRVAPIFLVSSVAGTNLDLLKAFLNLLPAVHEPDTIDEHPQFQVEETFDVHNVGPIVAGTLLQGLVRVGDKLLLGPDATGDFCAVTVSSIHRNRIPYRTVKSGQMASFLLDGVSRADIRTGQVLVHPELKPQSIVEFEAEIFLLHHPTTLTPKFQVTVYVGSVRQTAQIVEIRVAEDAESGTQVCPENGIKSGDDAVVRFRLTTRPEFVQVGQRILFRDGPSKAKGIGTVTSVFSETSSTRHSPSH